MSAEERDEALLRNHATSAATYSGLQIEITPSEFWKGKRRQYGYYDVRIAGTVTGPMSFAEAWAYINGARSTAVTLRGAG